MQLARYVETLSLLGDESRLRLCALLTTRELCVTDLVRITGITQSRVSTHLGRLREAGLVRDRKQGTQAFYGLTPDGIPHRIKELLDEAVQSEDPVLIADRQRLAKLDAERREGLPDSVADQMAREYSPGRTWQSLALGTAALLELGDVLDVGSGDGAAASTFAPYCRSLVCVDSNPRLVKAASQRLAKSTGASALMADAHALPFTDASFDAVLVFHTLTYALDPATVLSECARVLRPGGRLVVLCLDRHTQHDVMTRYGERHAGFSPRKIRSLLTAAGLSVLSAEVACREPKTPHLQVVLAAAQKVKS